VSPVVRQALDFSTCKAIPTAVLRWLALVIVTMGTLLLTGVRIPT
jgi:hypothetical protein